MALEVAHGAMGLMMMNFGRSEVDDGLDGELGFGGIWRCTALNLTCKSGNWGKDPPLVVIVVVVLFNVYFRCTRSMRRAALAPF